MPDESTETVHDPGPSVSVVYDRDGREHYASRSAKWVVDGLADGSLITEAPQTEDLAGEETPDGAEVGSAGDDPKPSGRRGRSGNGGTDPAGTDGNS